jgi:hypothetical protein
MGTSSGPGGDGSAARRAKEVVVRGAAGRANQGASSPASSESIPAARFWPRALRTQFPDGANALRPFTGDDAQRHRDRGGADGSGRRVSREAYGQCGTDPGGSEATTAAHVAAVDDRRPPVRHLQSLASTPSARPMHPGVAAFAAR